MSDQTEHPNSDQPGVDATPPPDSTIPQSDTGVAAGYTGQPSTFEPEEVAPETGADSGADDDAQSGGTGPRTTEATAMSGEDLSIFQTHWDDFAGHVD